MFGMIAFFACLIMTIGVLMMNPTVPGVFIAVPVLILVLVFAVIATVFTLIEKAGDAYRRARASATDPHAV